MSATTTKSITVQELATAIATLLADGTNIVLGTVTGSKIGTATSQKLGFYNAAPVVQPAGTVDLLASLVTLGLRAASSNPPLNLGTGAITGGATSVTTLTNSGDFTVGDATNLVLNATTGSKIGTATTQKLGFYNATPVVRPSAYTQTYATADKTHANPTATTLTDNSAGTANTTIEALANGTVYATDVAAIRNNFADLAASDNAIIVDLADLKQLVNSIIDDLQALGLAG